MRKALVTAALTLGALGITAGAASASESVEIDHKSFDLDHKSVEVDNSHDQHIHGGLVNLALQDVLTNADILNNVNVLGDGVNVGDVNVAD